MEKGVNMAKVLSLALGVLLRERRDVITVAGQKQVEAVCLSVSLFIHPSIYLQMFLYLSVCTFILERGLGERRGFVKTRPSHMGRIYPHNLLQELSIPCGVLRNRSLSFPWHMLRLKADVSQLNIGETLVGAFYNPKISIRLSVGPASNLSKQNPKFLQIKPGEEDCVFLCCKL